jgi:drug/metabolite transporter (DMT)-like permease
VAYALYFGSFDKLSAQTVAVFGYLDPVAAVILSALILRESMDAPQIFGAVLILAAAVAGDITWKKKK